MGSGPGETRVSGQYVPTVYMSSMVSVTSQSMPSLASSATHERNLLSISSRGRFIHTKRGLLVRLPVRCMRYTGVVAHETTTSSSRPWAQ